MAVTSKVTLLISLVIIGDTLRTLAQTTPQLNGNNVCTATISNTQLRKVPIAGIQTKIVRYVTKCGIGLLQCSRYRTIYVPAYREQMGTVYRHKNVCCAGHVAVNGQCVPRVTTTPDPSLQQATVRQSKFGRGYPSYPERNGATNGRADRRPTQRNKPFNPQGGGIGNDYPMTSHNNGGGLIGDGLDYDKSPDLHTPGGSGTISVTLGVAVFMSLTGMLIGILLMKIRTRNAKAIDAVPLTRNMRSRRTTRKTPKSVSGMVSKKSQKQRVVSYVDIMDIREKLAFGTSSPDQKKRIIPQFSLPRIPEGLAESAEYVEQDENNESLVELKELTPAARTFPPYAIVRKSKKEVSYAEPQVPKTEDLDESAFPGYAKVDEIQERDPSTLTMPEEGSSKNTPGGQDDKKKVKSLYAKVNKNVNQSHIEHRYSHGSFCESDADDIESQECCSLGPEDEYVYGRLDRPFSRSDNDLLLKENSFKYDRLRRGPHPRSGKRPRQHSELYESI